MFIIVLYIYASIYIIDKLNNNYHVYYCIIYLRIYYIFAYLFISLNKKNNNYRVYYCIIYLRIYYIIE